MRWCRRERGKLARGPRVPCKSSPEARSRGSVGGEGMSGRSKTGAVTLLDVATRAGGDRSVVSRVLSDDPRLNIRDETRARVLEVVAELDYRPNAVARSLRTQRADTYGLLIPDFGNPVYASIIQGAEAAAVARDCVLMTGSIGSGTEQAAHHLDVIGRGRVDGLLVAGDQADREQLAELDRRAI